ncbi:hypothetical protein LZ017_21950, partial [Pelomonas sp. CA6]|uniref:hypothetical protein n=1 Tax=Pelomonas sp. CA6 TaxID=2907999 RepID=UPI001F4C435C
GELNLAQAQLAAQQQLVLGTPGALTTDGAKLSGGRVDLSAQSWSHRAGQLAQIDASGMARLTAHGLLDNTGGTIAANARDLSMSAGVLNNAQGSISHAGQGSWS